MDTKVSIIVPIYNQEQYLKRCLDSLVNQTFKDIEIILVNDASSDNSDAIMRDYESRYSDMIRCIFLTENIRQGGARNRGLEIAKGNYICYVDGDDWVNPDYVKSLYEEAIRTDSDIVYCRYQMTKPGLELTRQDFFPEQIGDQNDKRKKACMLLSGTGPCWCIIRRSLLIENKLYFPEKMLYEDMAIFPIVSYYSKRSGYTDGAIYYYFLHPQSTVHKQDANHQRDEAKAILYLLKQMKERGIADRFPVETEAIFTRYFYGWGMNACYGEKFSVPPLDYMEYLAKEIHRIYPEYRSNRYFFGNIEPKQINQMFENDDKWFGSGEGCKVDYSEFYHKQESVDKIKNLSDACQGKHVVVWGLDQRCRNFLDSFDFLRIDSVLDNNLEVTGTTLDSGQIVKTADVGLPGTDVVLVTNKKKYSEAVTAVKALGERVTVINIEIYLLFDFALEECMKEYNS